jgi:hypothetical protein
LFVYGFGVFIVIMLVTPLGTTSVVVLALPIPAFAIFSLAAGN